MVCRFCKELCGEREFCSEECYKEYCEETAVQLESYHEDCPGESQYLDDEPFHSDAAW